MSRTVFSGPDAMKDFLNPNNWTTPLVELPDSLNPLAFQEVRIFAKRMDMLPLGNIKSLPAFNMLSTATLESVDTLVENSSGNTVFSLAILGRLFGIPQTLALVSNEVSQGKLDMLRLFDTQVMVKEEPICPDPNDPSSGIHLARNMGTKEGYFNPGQYDNQANPNAHYAYTGPQIWKQTEGKLTVFCAGLGTTGTLVGTSAYLKEQGAVTVIGVTRAPNNPVPGVRTQNLLEQIAFDWRSAADSLQVIGTQESFLYSLRLCREGLLVGPSSGFALAGLQHFLDAQHEQNQLDALRNSDGEVIAVFICCDSPLPYLHEYFEYLPEEHFLPIQNAELLPNAPAVRSPQLDSFDIQASNAYESLYSERVSELWEKVNKGEEVPVLQGVTLLDVRRLDEYEDAHLPGALHIEMDEVLDRLTELESTFATSQVYVICRSGNRSARITEALRRHGIQAWNLQGGMVEWSEKNLPRIRPGYCVIKHTAI